MPNRLALFTILLALPLLLVSTGCGIRGGETLVKYERGTTGDRVRPVPYSGVVGLYSGSDLNPDITFDVTKGTKVGFKDTRRESGGGEVRAFVEGMYDAPLNQGTFVDRTYYWNIDRRDD
jgi:hypothetical protein